LAAPAFASSPSRNREPVPVKDGARVDPTKEAWNPLNDPGNFGVGAATLSSVRTTAYLPQAAIGWSGDYWATYKGGISLRWQTAAGGSSYKDYLYQVLFASQLPQLSRAQVNGMSPAEKYDLYVGHTNFPLTQSEKTKTRNAVGADGEVPHWFGICHGWAAASYREPEPGAIVSVRAPNGQIVDFTHGDLEALISQVYADIPNDRVRFVGSRCNAADIARDANGRPIASECRDLNPATFHLVLDALIGRQQRGFVADGYQGDQVWNYPVVGYETAYSNRRPLDGRDPLRAVRAPGTVELIDVATMITHVSGSRSSTTPTGHRLDHTTFRYSLELDGQGRIIGGEWISEDHPDFLWEVTQAPAATPGAMIDYGVVSQLLRASLGATSPSQPTSPGRPTSLMSLTRLDLVPTGFFQRVDIVAEGRVDVTRVAEVRIVAVRGNGARDVIERTRPASDGRFSLSDTVAPRFAVGVAIEAIGADGAVLARSDRTLQ
jgi:hypothetical protein